MNLFQQWQLDDSKQRESVLFQDSGLSREYNFKIPELTFYKSVSNPDLNDTGQKTFWTGITDYFSNVWTDTKAILKMKSETPLNKILNRIDETIKKPINIGVDVVKNTSSAISTLYNSGLFKIVMFILIAVILFFLLKSYGEKQGVKLAT